MTETNSLKLTLDPQRLAAIIDSTVIATSEVVNFHFTALLSADLTKSPELVEVKFKIRGPELTAIERRAMHERWLLAKAFQELLRAVRHALEEAHVYVSLLTKPHKIATRTTLSGFLKPFQSKAASMRFPDLLSAVNEKLDPKLDFAESYSTLQMARNCLEHRDGVITKIETHGGDRFILSMPRMKLFYMRGDIEVEVMPGDTIEPGDDQTSVQLLMKLDVRQRSVALGERLTFTLEEFNEIAFACHFLGQQLSTKLPKPISPQGTVEAT